MLSHAQYDSRGRDSRALITGLTTRGASEPRGYPRAATPNGSRARAQGTGAPRGGPPGEATADSLKSRPGSFKRMLGSRCREDACQQSLLVVNQENRAARFAVHPDEAPSPERYWRHRHQPDQPSLGEVQAERGVFRILPFKVSH